MPVSTQFALETELSSDDMLILLLLLV